MNEMNKIPDDAVALFDPIRADMDALAKLNAELTFDYESDDGNKAARSHVYKLRLVKGRIEKAHKVAKAEALAVCQALDSMKRDYTAEVDALIAVHEKPILAIEERAARAKFEAEEKARREKEEADRKVREDQEARAAELARKEREIAEREERLRRAEEDAKRREQEEIARRESAERQRIEAEELAKKQADEQARAEAEKKRAAKKAKVLFEQAKAEAAEDLSVTASDKWLDAIVAGNIRHVRFVVEG